MSDPLNSEACSSLQSPLFGSYRRPRLPGQPSLRSVPARLSLWLCLSESLTLQRTPSVGESHIPPRLLEARATQRRYTHSHLQEAECAEMTQVLAVAKHSPCAHDLPCSLCLDGVIRAHQLCSRYICPWSVESCLPKGIRITCVSSAQWKRQNTHIAEQRSLLSTAHGCLGRDWRQSQGGWGSKKGVKLLPMRRLRDPSSSQQTWWLWNPIINI